MGQMLLAGSRFVGGTDYKPLDERSVIDFLSPLANASSIIGGASNTWSVREVGDGNLNLVFIVKGTEGGIVVKQALPYVRMVGESWPLPLDRAYFEHEALKIQTLAAPHLVPKLYHFDTMQAACVMEWLEPHIIVRKGLIKGIRYPKLAADIAEFCALTLFKTSDLGSPASEKRERQARFSHNITLSKITEDLVFTDPYRLSDMNRWTTPQLDKIAAGFRADASLKLAVQELKWMFLSRGEALLHGDLHTGSIMATESNTRVIDPEFAVYGPMGFDLGAFMANLLLAFFAQEGHATKEDDREDYRVWILDTLESFWKLFEQKFLSLWSAGSDGDAFLPELFADDTGEVALEAYRHMTMTRLFHDAIGFTGAKMARRILGLAHVEDLESIADPDRRAISEKRALKMARALMVGRNSFSAISDIRDIAETIAKEPIA
jgi:5-methylthioribose kinase